MNRTPTRHDLMACNLVLAAIAVLLMVTMRSSIKVVHILEGGTVAGFYIGLGYNHTVGQEDESPCIPRNTRICWSS